MIPALSRLGIGRMPGPQAEPAAGPAFGFKLLAYQGELDQIAGWVLAHPDRETGGDLLGFWTHSGAPALQFVLGPGPQARHEVAAFYQDDDYMREAVRAGQERHGLQQVGEWHSHHRLNLAEPSNGDVHTLMRMFDHHPIDRFVLCIATLAPSSAARRPGGWRAAGLGRLLGGDDATAETVEIGAFLFRRGHAGFLRGLWVVLPGESPVAGDLRAHSAARPASSPRRVWSVAQTTLDHSFGVGHPPPEGWYTRPEATAFLRAFDLHCRHAYAGCRMSLDDGTFCFGFASGGLPWELRFPPFFPEGPIALVSLAARGPPAHGAVVQPEMWASEAIAVDADASAASLLAAVNLLLAGPAAADAPLSPPEPVVVDGVVEAADVAPAAVPAPEIPPVAEPEVPMAADAGESRTDGTGCPEHEVP